MFLFRKNNDNSKNETEKSLFLSLHKKQQLNQLENALTQNEFKLALQPKINLHDWSICGVEALLRWQHPEYGILPPSHFIASIEKSSLHKSIFDWQINTISSLNKNWLDIKLNPLPIAINISISQLLDNKFVAHLSKTFERNNTPAENIELDINNTLENVPENIDDILQQIKATGVKLSLKYSVDGFPIEGMIINKSVDCLNIDKELIWQITRNPDSRKIMTAIMKFAHDNDVKVMAEGIETAEQLIFLNAVHCDMASGFIISPPLSYEKLTDLYRSGKRFDSLIEKIGQVRLIQNSLKNRI